MLIRKESAANADGVVARARVRGNGGAGDDIAVVTNVVEQGKRMPANGKDNILLVDDRPENLVALESVLGDLGQNLILARSGKEALRRVLHDEFAVILLDVQMPEMDGFETATLIRQREKTRHTPILFLTAFNKTEVHAAKGYSVGAVDYVFKPFQPEILRAKVAAFVELSKKQRELQAEIARRKEAEEEVRRLNADLERRVRDRTAKLEEANQALQKEIAERTRAEAHIQALNERLQRAMTETHHRVKNNLQIIAAMVDMRLMEGPQSIPSEEIHQLGLHVRTLAAVHEILTQEAKDDGQAHFVSARSVLERLIPLLAQTAGGRDIRLHVEDAQLSARQGTSLALVVNELVSNAVKHGKDGIDVTFRIENDRAVLSVCDDGPGFPAGFDPQRSANTGLDLIQHLSRWDLGGETNFENRPKGGACVTIRMPLPNVA